MATSLEAGSGARERSGCRSAGGDGGRGTPRLPPPRYSSCKKKEVVKPHARKKVSRLIFS